MSFKMTEMPEGHPAKMTAKERETFFTKVKEKSL